MPALTARRVAAVLGGALAFAFGAAAQAAGAATPAAGSAPGSGALKSITGPLSWSAQGDVELERNHFSANGVEIIDTSHGTTRVVADRVEANGPDIGNSQWVLTGHVQVQMPQGTLRADSATVQIDHNHIVSMRAEGAPAEFERSGVDGDMPAHGHARTIDYDLERERLQLDGDSWLTDGCNEVDSQHIQYDIAAGRVEALSGGGARVHGVIRARAPSQCAPTAAPSPAGPRP